MATAEKQVAPSPKPTLPPHPFSKLCANHVKVVVQQKGGTIIKGTAKWFRSGYLKVTEAEIIGRGNRVTVPWILIENHAIAHLHPDGGEVTPVALDARVE